MAGTRSTGKSLAKGQVAGVSGTRMRLSTSGGSRKRNAETSGRKAVPGTRRTGNGVANGIVGDVSGSPASQIGVGARQKTGDGSQPKQM